MDDFMYGPVPWAPNSGPIDRQAYGRFVPKMADMNLELPSMHNMHGGPCWQLGAQAHPRMLVRGGRPLSAPVPPYACAPPPPFGLAPAAPPPRPRAAFYGPPRSPYCYGASFAYADAAGGGGGGGRGSGWTYGPPPSSLPPPPPPAPPPDAFEVQAECTLCAGPFAQPFDALALVPHGPCLEPVLQRRSRSRAGTPADVQRFAYFASRSYLDGEASAGASPRRKARSRVRREHGVPERKTRSRRPAQPHAHDEATQAPSADERSDDSALDTDEPSGAEAQAGRGTRDGRRATDEKRLSSVMETSEKRARTAVETREERSRTEIEAKQKRSKTETETDEEPSKTSIETEENQTIETNENLSRTSGEIKENQAIEKIENRSNTSLETNENSRTALEDTEEPPETSIETINDQAMKEGEKRSLTRSETEEQAEREIILDQKESNSLKESSSDQSEEIVTEGSEKETIDEPDVIEILSCEKPPEMCDRQGIETKTQTSLTSFPSTYRLGPKDSRIVPGPLLQHKYIPRWVDFASKHDHDVFRAAVNFYFENLHWPWFADQPQAFIEQCVINEVSGDLRESKEAFAPSWVFVLKEICDQDQETDLRKLFPEFVARFFQTGAFPLWETVPDSVQQKCRSLNLSQHDFYAVDVFEKPLASIATQDGNQRSLETISFISDL